MHRFVLLLAAAVALVVTGGPAATAAGRFTCQVSSPISAAALNAGGTWSFEAFDGTPGGTYWAKVQWAGDPSNGGHPNTSIGPLDAAGHGITTLPARWAPDGSLPGYTNPDGSFTAAPGDFSVHLYPVSWEPDTQGTANCKGVVGP